MSDAPFSDGPLHLRKHLMPCPQDLAKVIAGCVSHSVSTLRGISCTCRRTPIDQRLTEDEQSDDPKRRKRASDRKDRLRQHQADRMGSSSRIPALPLPPPGGVERRSGEDRRSGEERRAEKPADSQPCTLFIVELNDEEGVVRAFCRRCQQLYPIFDRALYWGTRRKEAKTPPSWGYRCGCGGHSFELGLGFDYSDDAMDENDIHTLTVAVRCAACGEVSVIFDEEAT